MEETLRNACNARGVRDRGVCGMCAAAKRGLRLRCRLGAVLPAAACVAPLLPQTRAFRAWPHICGLPGRAITVSRAVRLTTAHYASGSGSLMTDCALAPSSAQCPRKSGTESSLAEAPRAQSRIAPPDLGALARVRLGLRCRRRWRPRKRRELSGRGFRGCMPFSAGPGKRNCTTKSMKGTKGGSGGRGDLR